MFICDGPSQRLILLHGSPSHAARSRCTLLTFRASVSLQMWNVVATTEPWWTLN